MMSSLQKFQLQTSFYEIASRASELVKSRSLNRGKGLRGARSFLDDDPVAIRKKPLAHSETGWIVKTVRISFSRLAYTHKSSTAFLARRSTFNPDHPRPSMKQMLVRLVGYLGALPALWISSSKVPTAIPGFSCKLSVAACNLKMLKPVCRSRIINQSSKVTSCFCWDLSILKNH